ncbi:murein biosynthesis integral membrane protein MurJ [Clostridium perfringens]|uniref:murein biosynthesis integral membrane protein MurJ n=1 Tax=Clostridium perfringens TaxID=1502 RepID=UPI0039EB0895
MKKNKVLIFMMLINVISMLFGFLRDSSIAYVLGATNISDIFMFIINLPTVLFSAMGWVIMSTFIPIYTDIKVNETDRQVNKFSNTFMKLMTIISILIVLILYIFNRYAIRILAPGFTGESFNITKDLFFIVLPSLIFLTISSCYSVILNACKKMLWVSGIGIVLNIAIILSILFIYPYYGMKVAVIGVTFGCFMQIIVLLKPTRETGFFLTKDFDLKDNNIKRTLNMIGPMIIGVMAQQINTMFSGSITSMLESGSLTSYNLATKVTNAMYGSVILIGISFIFPYLSEYFSKGEFNNFIKEVKRAIELILLILIPATILILLLNDNIISILYGHGKFSQEDIKITGEILFYLSIGIITLGIRELIYRSYYACKNTNKPMVFSVFSIILNIVLSVLLMKKLGVLGVALGNSIATVISCIAIYIYFEKDMKIKSLISKKDITKYIFITVILYFLGSLIKTLILKITTSNILIIIIVSIILMSIYLGLIILFRIEIVYDFIKKRFKIYR